MAECRSKIVFDGCNCAFYFFRTPYANTTICNTSHINCILQAVEMQQKTTHSEFNCICLPACWEVTYKTTLSTSELLEHSQITESTGLPVDNLALLRVFFKHRSFRANSKRAQVSFTDFLCELEQISVDFFGSIYWMYTFFLFFQQILAGY